MKKGEKHREFLFVQAGPWESTPAFGKYPHFWKAPGLWESQGTFGKFRCQVCIHAPIAYL